MIHFFIISFFLTLGVPCLSMNNHTLGITPPVIKQEGVSGQLRYITPSCSSNSYLKTVHSHEDYESEKTMPCIPSELPEQPSLPIIHFKYKGLGFAGADLRLLFAQFGTQLQEELGLPIHIPALITKKVIRDSRNNLRVKMSFKRKKRKSCKKGRPTKRSARAPQKEASQNPPDIIPPITSPFQTEDYDDRNPIVDPNDPIFDQFCKH